MNKFEQLLDDYVRYNMRYCTDTDGFDKEGLQRIKNMLIERDKKLVEALKAVVTADYSQAYEPRKIAKQALINIGEDI